MNTSAIAASWPHIRDSLPPAQAGLAKSIDELQARIAALLSSIEGQSGELARIEGELSAYTTAAADFTKRMVAAGTPNEKNPVQPTVDAFTKYRDEINRRIALAQADIASLAAQRDGLIRSASRYVVGGELVAPAVMAKPVVPPVVQVGVDAPSTPKPGKPTDAAKAAAAAMHKRHGLTAAEERKLAELCADPAAAKRLADMPKRDLLAFLA